MHIDWWTLALQTVNVIILVWLLNHFLFKPVAAVIKARQAEANAILDEAAATKAEAETERTKARQANDRLAEAHQKALADIAAEAATEKAARLAAVGVEIDRLRATAEAELLDRARHADEIALNRASRLAVDIAGKLLDRLPADVRVAGFVDGLADAIAALPETTRSAMGQTGDDLTLKAPRALTDAERTAIQARLAEALGRKVAVTVEIEPTLIAGLELETPHAQVCNSFRADLARVASELTQHDKG
ncbi:MAG: H+transporting two-sector ATPase subunit [Proteobacteria bacterium]|nr:H+transporting two-sector ATPase subunit [Pseudomonadota bacterium]